MSEQTFNCARTEHTMTYHFFSSKHTTKLWPQNVGTLVKAAVHFAFRAEDERQIAITAWNGPRAKESQMPRTSAGIKKAKRKGFCVGSNPKFPNGQATSIGADFAQSWVNLKLSQDSTAK